MRISFHGLVYFIFLVLIACTVKEEIVSFHGRLTENNRSKMVLLDPIDFINFDVMVDRIEGIVCNDSIPSIAIKNGKELKVLGLSNLCWNQLGCYRINQRNILKIVDSTIFKKEPRPLDSLEHYLRKHFLNSEKLDNLSESPYKSSISIVFKDNDLNTLKNVISHCLEYHAALNLDAKIYLSLDKKSTLPL